MTSRKVFVLLLIILSSISIFAQKKYPKFQGNPESNSNFVNFIRSNLGKTVYLKLSISNGEFVTDGYRGVQPYFEGRKTNGISYSFFLECQSDENLTPIEECRQTKWNANPDGSGVMSGYFNISRIIRTEMRNYRAVFLIPVKAK